MPVLAELHRLADPKNVAGMARFGIFGKNWSGKILSEVLKP